ncbi:MAG: protocatechuate 4,5-dioxygenase subunit alpha [Candidatus Tectomicrobia bacterium]|nr:protocatechuate 4,5-dioxygenase subunit alpha [Candidatus Tectomicrobia bacterium]
MALEKPYKDIPGTTVFDSTQARRGYLLNQFFYSLIRPGNRERFLADEDAYLDAWPISDEQKAAVRARDYNEVITLGGNVYFFSKLFFTDEQSFEVGAASMTGMAPQDYRQMMISGGRPIEGNRFEGED